MAVVALLVLDGQPFHADQLPRYRALIAHADEPAYRDVLAELAP